MSKIEVNAIEPQCGTDLTVGASGDTITFPTGTTIVNNGTQTGFGRTGTVDWDTTAKTASFTAVSGNGYFVNTTSAAITLTLPATPSAGDIVAFKDYAFTFATNNLTVDGNGSPIGGIDGTLLPTYSVNGTSKTFIYADGTKGWLVVNESTDTSQELNPLFTVATGGTITECGDYKIHTFTGPGTFCVSVVGNAPTVPVGGPNTSSYLVIAGGGGGGSTGGGGGGAGGFREGRDITPSYTASPLVAPVGLTLTATAYPITVGAGGGGAVSGSNSIFSTITSAGGGRGDSMSAANAGFPGGSGGGGARKNSPNNLGNSGGSGNTPPVSPPQGNNGGNGSGGPGVNSAGGGGGGAGGGGSNSSSPPGQGGNGGSAISTSITGSSVPRAGGGGGGGNSSAGGNGGGGSTSGSTYSPTPTVADATANTGSGAGGGGTDCGLGNSGGAGGSGVVIIRYKFQ
jgi:hypothetical protein